MTLFEPHSMNDTHIVVFIRRAVVHLGLVVNNLQVTRLQPEVQLDAVGHIPECLQGCHLRLCQRGHSSMAAGCGS